MFQIYIFALIEVIQFNIFIHIYKYTALEIMLSIQVSLIKMILLYMERLLEGLKLFEYTL